MSAKVIRNLIRGLQRQDEAAQIDALEALGKFGPLAFEAIPKLIKLLGEHNDCILSRTATILGRMGPIAAPALPALRELMSQDSSGVRHNALKAIQRIGPVALPDLLNSFLYDRTQAKVHAAQAMAALGADALPALEALTLALSEKSADVRIQAAKTLAALRSPIDEHLPRIISILKKVPDENRPQLAAALSVFPKVAKAAVPILQKMLAEEPKTGQRDERAAVIVALGKIGAPSSVALPELIALITGPDNPLRSAAITAIGRMGASAADVVPEFLRMLPTAGDKRSILIVEALGNIGPEASAAAPTLVQMLTSAYGELRETILTTLGKLGPAASVAVPTLLRMLEDITPAVRLDALVTLHQLGLADATSIQAVAARLDDAHSGVRRAALEALGTVANANLDDGIRRRIQGLLMDRDSQVRRKSAQILGQGSIDPTLIDRYRQELTHPHLSVRFEAAELLWYLTNDGTDSLPVLRETLVESDRKIRQATLQLLRAMAVKHPEALAALMQGLRNPDEPLGRPAANAIIEFGKAAIPALRAAIRDTSAIVRSGALYVIGRLGQSAQSAIPDIIPALEDPEADVRWAAASALGALRTTSAEAITGLTKMLSDESATARGWASLALGQLGKVVLPSLVPILQRGSAKAQASACEVLARIGPPGLAIISHVGPLLREEDRHVQEWANRAIDSMCRDIEAEVSPYLELLKSPPREIQEWAAHQLAARGTAIVPLMLKLMGNVNEEDLIWGGSETLALLGPAAEPAAPLLIRALEGEMDQDVQDRVGRAIATIGAPAVPLLVKSLRNPAKSVQLGAIDALARMKAEASESAPALVDFLANEPKPGVQRFVAEAIGEIGAAGVEALRTAIEQAVDPVQRARLIHGLGVIGSAAQPVGNVFAANLQHADLEVRIETLWSLPRVPLDPPALTAILPELVKSLEDESPRIREQAALTLGRLGANALPAGGKILPLLGHTQTEVRIAACIALAEIADHARNRKELSAVADEWFRQLEPIAQTDPEALVRGYAVRAIAHLPVTEASLSIIHVALQSSNTMVKIRTVDALGYMGAEGDRLLRQCLTDHNPIIRRTAMETLLRIRPKDLVMILGDKLADPDWHMVRRVATELTEMKEASLPVKAAMLRALRSPIEPVRESLFKLLQALDPSGETIIPALIEALVEKDMPTRAWAAEKLGKYGAKAEAAIPLLIVLLADRMKEFDFHVPTRAANAAGQALREIGAPAAPLLREAILQPTEHIRLRIFDALERTFYQSFQLLKPYRKQLGKPGPDVLEKIQEAFTELEPVRDSSSLDGLLAKLTSKGNSWRERWEASIAIGGLAKEKKLPEANVPEVIEKLLAATEDNDYDVREKSIEALGLIGPAAGAALERMVKLIGDNIAKVRTAAIIAAGRIGTENIKPEKLVKLLNWKKHSEEVTIAVLDILSKMPKLSPKLQEDMLKCTKAKSIPLQAGAIWAISGFGGKNKDVKTILLAKLGEVHPQLRATAAASLAKLGIETESALTALRSVLICREKVTRQKVITACALLGSKAESWLLQASASSAAIDRRETAAILGELPTLTASLEEALERLANTDLDESVRTAALAAKKRRSELASLQGSPKS